MPCFFAAPAFVSCKDAKFYDMRFCFEACLQEYMRRRFMVGQ